MPTNPISRLNQKQKIIGALFSLFLLLMLAWWMGTLVLDSITPGITHIPIVPEGKDLVIQGKNLGDRVGRVYLLTQPPSTLDVITWSNSEISARLPQGVKSGTVWVSTNSPLGLRNSSPHDFIIQAAGLPS